MKHGVLFISPSSDDYKVISGMLSAVSVPVSHAENLKRANGRLGHEAFGPILTEGKLADGKWEDVMDRVRRESLPSVVVVTDRLADARLWAEALDLGAYDVLAQPYDSAEVQRVVISALARQVAFPPRMERSPARQSAAASFRPA